RRRPHGQGRRPRPGARAGARRGPTRNARAGGADRRPAEREELGEGRRRGATRGSGGAVTPLKTRILVGDDHAVVRRGLRLILDAEPDLEVVAEAADGSEAVERALAEESLHLAILDVSMPRMTGLQAARELARRRPEVRTLILSMHDNEQYLFEALKAGASGYVLKSGADRDIVRACRGGTRGAAVPLPAAR